MSRYRFSQDIERERRARTRRVVLGAILSAVLLLGGVGLFILGLNALTGNRGIAATATPFVPVVRYLTPGAPTVINPTGAAGAPKPTTAAPAPTLAVGGAPDPDGQVAGIKDFTCPAPRSAPAKFGYGIQSNWPVGDIGSWNSVMADKLKLTWTKAQVRWKLYEPERGKIDAYQWQILDAFVGDANKKGLNILFGVIDAPNYLRTALDGGNAGPPDDFNEAARFFKRITARYKGCVQALEVWNEMNLDREWQTPRAKIVGSEYVTFLKAVVPAIRAKDPSMMVVMGALSPVGATVEGKYTDDFVYMDQFVAAGGPALVDCVGVHLNGFNLPPDKAWDSGYNDTTAKFRGPFDNPNHSWSFISTIKGYRERTNKPMCVTEFGWASMDGLGLTGDPPGFGFALDNTEQEQANWIVQGFGILRDLGYVRFGIVFNLDYSQKIGQKANEPGGDPALYSVLRPNGSTRPAFDAIERMDKNVP
ncbi:MAG: cellulase family glycosylhydrolase [Thermoflexales bacterium]|nr:cellulase family glycosylhydrolase [Thermoflexales bacterium]